MFARMGSFFKSKFSNDKKPETQQSPSPQPQTQSAPSTPQKAPAQKKIQQQPTPQEPINENLIPINEIEGINLFSEYPTHCANYINDFGKGLELMQDYSAESSSVAIKRAEKLNDSLEKMEQLTLGLEKYLNEMVMIAQTPKPNIANQITPFKRQRHLENLIISQINESSD